MHPEGLLQREIDRLHAHNDPKPDCCPNCGQDLLTGGGYVGEDILYCPAGCGIAWEDSEGAIRRVL